MKLYGYAILENALKGNTCFRESVASLTTIVDHTHIFIKYSVDGTEKALNEADSFHMHSIEERNPLLALQYIREICENIPEAWVLYLNPDEVLNVQDLELLREDILRANELNCDAICFRNLNFTLNPHLISISSESPAHSIRLFRLGSNRYIENEKSFDDKVYYSEVKLYNYAPLRITKEGLDGPCHADDELLNYLGPHPIIMKRRIENWGGHWDRIESAKVYIVGEPREYCPNFIKKIKAKKIFWVGNIVNVPAEDRTKAIIVHPTLFQKLFRPSKVPRKMKEKGSQDWTEEFILILKLSEKGIAVG